MTRKIIHLVFSFGVFFLVTNARADESHKVEKILNDVKQIVNSVYSNDVDTVISYTHKKIIEVMGGKETAKKLTTESLAKFAAMGMSIKALEFPSTPKFIQSSENEFVLVPTLSVIEANGQKIESLNFQLGIKELSSDDWKYVEGSRINKQNVNQFFPDFPTDVEFPQTYRKKI